MTLKDLDTYVFIDVSNIRAACLSSCGFRIDFIRLLKYLKNKYPRLKSVYYYEGIAENDLKKRDYHRMLDSEGYTIKSLERKSYTDRAVFKRFKCKKCGTDNRVQVLPKVVKMKSNVDVYLATDMVQLALSMRKPVHLVLMSCDGDYAEAIKTVATRRNIRITVMATPAVKSPKRNTLSTRLKVLSKELPGQYKLFNLEDIRDEIS